MSRLRWATRRIVDRLRERWVVRHPAGPEGPLHIRRSVPHLQVQPRDPVRAIDMLREPEFESDGRRPSDFDRREEERAERRRSTDLVTRIGSTFWYHTIELPGGVVTPGFFDHRSLVPQYGLPESLAGMAALDVATFDGFWAYEMERRGAKVTALDLACTDEIDFPPQAKERIAFEGVAIETGAGFSIASEALGSKVDRRTGSVYRLCPEEWGEFDFVHLGDLLLHLERPLEALRCVRSVTSGVLHLSDSFDPELEPGSVRYLGGWSGAVWWMPSLDTLCQMVIDSGFRSVEVLKAYRLDSVAPVQRGRWRAIIRATP